MKVSVVGLGKIGLPLAVQLASRDMYVQGCDISAEVVETINSGRSTFGGEPQLDELLSDAVASGMLTATTDTTGAVRTSSVVVVVVPLLVDNLGTPDFKSLDSATMSVGAGLMEGTLVVFETTLPVGTTRTRLTPILEEVSGLKAGRDFFVAFSPERVYSGQIFNNLRQYPKIVGGIDHESSRLATEFYSQAISFDAVPNLSRPNGVWDLGSAEAAELAKLAETTYRDVNIALANQFAVYAEGAGLDIFDVIDACNSQPFSHIHQPGVAVGGHCIPVYPHMYLLGDPRATVVEAARAANVFMPNHFLERIERKIGSLQGRKVAVLGLAYRGGVKEHAFSGAWSLVQGIRLRGGIPVVHDPLWTQDELRALGLEPHTLGDPSDVIVIQANHREYDNLSTKDLGGASLLADGRNQIPLLNNLGVDIIQLGRA